MPPRLAGPTLASPEPALSGHDTAADLGLQQNLGHQQAPPSYSTDTRVPQALVDKAYRAIAPGLADHYSPKELQDISYSLARHSLEEDARNGPVWDFLPGKNKRSVAIRYEHQFTQVQLPEPERGAATNTVPSASRTVQTQPGVYKHTDAQGRTTYSSSPDALLSPKEQEIYTQQRAQREQSMRVEHAQHNHHNRQEILQRFTQQALLSAQLQEQEAREQAALAQRQGLGGVVRGGQETITDTLKSPYYVYQSVKTHGVEGTLTNAAQATLELPGQVMKAIEQGDTQTLTGAALGVIPLTRGGKLAAVVDVPEIKGARPEPLKVANSTERVVLNSGGDRLLGAMGPARINHPAEYNAIINDLKIGNVDISYRPGQFAYGPAPSGGKPGNIIFDPNASLSAIKHEYGHYLDDAALGFPGQRYYYENPSARLATERRQYLEEIRTAHELGDSSARRQLIEDYLSEKKYLIDNYYTKPYGSHQ